MAQSQVEREWRGAESTVEKSGGKYYDRLNPFLNERSLWAANESADAAEG